MSVSLINRPQSPNDDQVPSRPATSPARRILACVPFRRAARVLHRTPPATPDTAALQAILDDALARQDEAEKARPRILAAVPSDRHDDDTQARS